MLTLYLLRHAEASGDFSTNDKARPLTKHGEQQAAQVGQYLHEHNCTIEQALCSTAQRTMQTLTKVVMQVEAIDQITHEDKLYNAPTSDILEQIGQTSNDVKHLLVVGHNPGIHQLAFTLAQKGNSHLINQISAGYSPATLSIFSIETNQWKDITQADSTLEKVVVQ